MANLETAGTFRLTFNGLFGGAPDRMKMRPGSSSSFGGQVMLQSADTGRILGCLKASARLLLTRSFHET
jgi:hypothetical protein